MSAIKLQGNAGGTGTLTVAAPSTNTNQTLTLPDNTGTFITNKTAGTVLQFITQNDAGSTTTSTTRVNLNGSLVSRTPLSSTSKLIIDVAFSGQITAVVAANTLATFDISEGSTTVSYQATPMGISSGAGANLQLNSSLFLRAVVTNSATTARSFSLYGKTSSASATASASGMTWTITEIAA
jgi:hypothetical protein